MGVSDFVTIAGLLLTPQIVGYVWGTWERATNDFIEEMMQ
jgi:hypothetical protein